MRIMILWLGAMWALVGVFGCGSPEMETPEALAVVYMPLNGAFGVDPSVTPEVYFSATLNESTITGDSVKLQSASATQIGNLVECDTEWAAVEGNASAGSGGRSVIFDPTALLAEESCYRLLITTALQGSNKELLRDLELPDATLTDVGAISSFSTRF